MVTDDWPRPLHPRASDAIGDTPVVWVERATPTGRTWVPGEHQPAPVPAAPVDEVWVRWTIADLPLTAVALLAMAVGTAHGCLVRQAWVLDTLIWLALHEPAGAVVDMPPAPPGRHEYTEPSWTIATMELDQVRRDWATAARIGAHR